MVMHNFIFLNQKMSENVSIFTTLISLIELAHFFCLFEGAAYFGNNVLTKFA